MQNLRFPHVFARTHPGKSGAVLAPIGIIDKDAGTPASHRSFISSLAESMSKLPRHYAISPHDDVENFFDNVQLASAHRLLQQKLALKPVFKDDAQREAFNKMANDWLGYWRGHEEVDPGELKATIYLEKRSRRTGSYARLSFAGVANPILRVYVIGHGSAGSTSIEPENRDQPKSAEEVADLLISMKLPIDSDVRANSCFSAAGIECRLGEREWWKHYYDGILSEALEPDRSFAGSLDRHLRDRGFTGKTYGYLTPITKSRRLVNSQGAAGAKATLHMGGVPVVRSEDGKLERLSNEPVRRRDIRVQFPYEARAKQSARAKVLFPTL